MMIRNNDVEHTAHLRHRLHRRDAAVHRDEQRAALFVNLPQRGQVDAVAFRKSIWDVVRDITAERADIFRQERRRGHTVHIIVAVDHDRHVSLDRVENACGGNLHVRHEERVVKRRFLGMQERIGSVGCTDAAMP